MSLRLWAVAVDHLFVVICGCGLNDNLNHKLSYGGDLMSEDVSEVVVVA